MAKCLTLPSLSVFVAIAKQAVESVYIRYGFGQENLQKPIMFSACIACLQETIAATYSAEHDESTTTVCLRLPHNKGVPFKYTMYPLTLCMEQNLGPETGELNSREENEIMKSLLDLSSPDPKSQTAIDKMPEAKKKRYNDARTKEFEGIQKKQVMEYKRMSDLPKGTKLYICVVNWTTKFLLGTYSKTKCRIQDMLRRALLCQILHRLLCTYLQSIFVVF
jgi:hypothetical protein